jgi:uncharacterized OB-fold protein
MEYKLSIKDYTAALKENRLLGLKCRDCGAVTVPPRMVCRQCAGLALDITPLSGHGKIVTFTSIHVASEERHGHTPYLVVMVELQEGAWIMGNLSDLDPHLASMELIGKAVETITPPVLIETRVDGVAPMFRLKV